LRRFSSDEQFARLIATGMASVAVSFLGLQCLRLPIDRGHVEKIRMIPARAGFPSQ
jgi:hypothetical protein